MLTLTVVGVDYRPYPSLSKAFDSNKIVPGTIVAAAATSLVPTAVTKFEYEDDSPRGRSVYFVTEATATVISNYESDYEGSFATIDSRPDALEADMTTAEGNITTLEELLASNYQVVATLTADWTSTDAEEDFALANEEGDVLLAVCTTKALGAKVVRVDDTTVRVTLSGNGALTDDIQVFVLRQNPA